MQNFNEENEKSKWQDLELAMPVVEREVNARNLHTYMSVARDFSTWMKALIKKYGFVEGLDFTNHKNVVGKNIQIDYVLTTDMAKEICMVQNNVKGRLARQYFIEVEKRARTLFNSQPKELSRLELIDMARDSEIRALELETKLEKAQPALEFTAQVKNSSQTNTCRNAAKLINQRPNKLCQWLLKDGYTYDSSQGRTVKQQYIDMGILEVKKVQDRNDDSKFRNQIFVTNKGLAYFSKKLMGVEL